MSASAVLGYALLALDNNEFGVMTAVIGALTTIVVAIITNFSESRRHKRELRYRSGGQSGSGLNTFLFVALLISVGAGIYYANRPAETNASAAPVEPTTPPADTTPNTTAVSTTSVPMSPATAAPTTGTCPLALSVQVSARQDVDDKRAEFLAQADQLVRRLPQLGELRSHPGADCNASGLTLFYVGPFTDEATALDACLGIGQILHDEITTFTTFVLKKTGATDYPFYRDQRGARVLNDSGGIFLCSPS